MVQWSSLELVSCKEPARVGACPSVVDYFLGKLSKYRAGTAILVSQSILYLIFTTDMRMFYNACVCDV